MEQKLLEGRFLGRFLLLCSSLVLLATLPLLPTSALLGNIIAGSSHKDSREKIMNTSEPQLSLSDMDKESEEEAAITIQPHYGNNSTNIPPPIPFNASHLPKLAFIHIGKTAGTTLAFQINGACMNPSICRKTRPLVQNESLPARAMTRYFHITQMDTLFKPSQFDGYILPVRNPIDRIVSAYLMSHSKNAHPHAAVKKKKKKRKIDPLEDYFYNTCFPNANTLAEDGLAGDILHTNTSQLVSTNDWLSLSCRDLAYSVVAGHCRQRLFWHFYYNYQRYCGKILEELARHEQSNNSKLVLVVRQEYLWQDWNNLHLFLGGNSTSTNPAKPQQRHAHVHDSRSFPERNKTLSQQGYHNMCRVLRDEIQIYLQVIQRATNLNPQQKMEAMETIQTQCGDSLVVRDLLI
jgi:hypothetical protein